MPDWLISVLIPVGFVVIAGVGLVLLISPSLYFRSHPNRFNPDTPWNRLQMRLLGLMLCLFAIVPLGWWLSDVVNSQMIDGFSSNISAALAVTFIAAITTGVMSAILWRFSAFRSLIRRTYPSDRLQGTAWNRRVTLISIAALVLIVATSLVLAANGYHP
jgi:hypothetical protein